jgi:hypothetical protein
MNRIYQGKVTAVEIPAPPILSASTGERNKGEVSNQNQSQPLDLDVLWRHHELFQDAVNSETKE